MRTMKIALSFLLIGLTAQAELIGSNLNPRHQVLIEQAAAIQCGLTRGEVAEVSTIAYPIKIDQGITDYTFVTEVEVRQRVDQMMYDLYQVVVTSSYSDSFDHTTSNWGVYKIESVSTCVQK